MRLTNEQKSTIRRLVKEAFGDAAHVRLFGSRVDDDAMGGDVDLLVETPERVALAAELKLAANLENQLGEPVDIITTSAARQKRPIVEIAKLTGIEL